MAWNPFDHHRGPFTFVVTRPKVHPRKGEYPFTTENLPGTTSGADVEEEARALLTDPRDSIVSVAVWSVTEQQHIVTYTQKDVQRWIDNPDRIAPIVKEPDACPALVAATGIPSAVATNTNAPTAIRAKAQASARRKTDNGPKPEKRTRGAKLVIGKAEAWPTSQGAQIIRRFFEASNRQVTAQEIVTAVGAQLTAAGIEFPGSLVSRLKQAGFLTEAA